MNLARLLVRQIYPGALEIPWKHLTELSPAAWCREEGGTAPIASGLGNIAPGLLTEDEIRTVRLKRRTCLHALARVADYQRVVRAQGSPARTYTVKCPRRPLIPLTCIMVGGEVREQPSSLQRSPSAENCGWRQATPAEEIHSQRHALAQAAMPRSACARSAKQGQESGQRPGDSGPGWSQEPGSSQVTIPESSSNMSEMQVSQL